MKKQIKTIVAALFALGLVCYTVFSLSALSAPVRADFSTDAAFAAAEEAFAAERAAVHAHLTIGALAAAALAFALEAAPVAVVAMCLPIYFSLTGILSFEQAFSGFANSTVILFAGMFVLGAAMFQTGLAQRIGLLVVRLFAGSEKKLTLGVMLLTAGMSAFLSNTGTVAVLLPVCIGIADSQGWSRAKLLFPMAILSSAGGMCTLIGTPPNLTVNAVLTAYGYEGLSFFEYAWFGVPATLLAILYFALFGRRIIPERVHHDAQVSPAHEVMHSTKKQWIAGGILLLVILFMALDCIPLALVAAIGALAAVIFGCIDEKQAYQAIDWSTIFLFAGALSLANAMASTGAGSILANLCIRALGGSPSPYVLFSVLFLACGVLTQFMSNTASAALLCPIGLEIASSLGVSPMAVVLALGFSASAAYCTPIATPPNTLICGPGSLKFLDFVKVGGPLFLLTYLLALALIPLRWPFALA